MIKKKTITLKTIEDTKKIANEIAKMLKKNSVVLISGELGVGKTTLTKFIGTKLGIKENINSPTFQVLKRYLLKKEIFLNHYDFFRLEKEEKLKRLLPEMKELSFNNINIIEWPEKDPYYFFWEDLKNFDLVIVLKFEKSENNKRKITITILK